MSCFGCEKKEQLTNLAVDVLVEEQLAVEINRASLLVQSNRTKICDRCPLGKNIPVANVVVFTNFVQVLVTKTVQWESGNWLEERTTERGT